MITTCISFRMVVSCGEKGRRKESENKALDGTFCFFKYNLLYYFQFALNVSQFKTSIHIVIPSSLCKTTLNEALGFILTSKLL